MVLHSVLVRIGVFVSVHASLVLAVFAFA
jgi:hypothetical protein